ncbi:MAG TPA: YbjQ family protein [Polyangiaceae bacterium]
MSRVRVSALCAGRVLRYAQPKPQPAPQDAYRFGVERIVHVLVTTGNDVAGHRITQYLGVVRGIVVRSPSIGQGIVGAFKSIGGGNIQEYAEVCEAARHDAYVQMVQHAEQLGAHAIIGMRYDATEFMQSVTEVLAYGTAVRLETA